MNRFLNRIFEIIKPYIHLEVLGFFLTILYSIAVFGSPMVSKYLIDEVIPANSERMLYSGIFIFFIVCISQPIIGFFKDLLFLHITENITFDIRRKMFFKVINAPLKFFDSTTRGEIISRILNDGRGASQFITNFFVIFIKNIALITMVLIGMIMISPMLTLIMISLFITFMIINNALTKKFQEMSLELHKNYDTACTNINQTSEHIMSIKSYLGENKNLSENENLLKKMYKDNKRVMKLNVFLNNFANVLMVLSLCIIYGLGGIYVMQGKLSLGSVIALGLYFQLLSTPVYELTSNRIEYQKAIPIFDRLYEYFDMEEENFKESDLKLCENSKSIDIKNLSFSYKNEVPALNDVTMFIPNNSVNAFIGHSGSGKSTLVKILLRLYEFKSGDVKIGNNSIKNFSLKDLRENISFVPQDPEMFSTSIKNNLKYGNESATDEEIQNICKNLGLHDKIMSLPDKYDTLLTERTNLSGGEKQRISIARALLKTSSILIMDEPSSSLDPENRSRLKEVIDEFSKRKTIIIIAHNKETIENADNIFSFESGKVTQIKSNDTSKIV